MKLENIIPITLSNDRSRFEQTERGCCNRRLLDLADCDWKFIFKVAYPTKPIICVSKQQPNADKSATPPQVERKKLANRQKIRGRFPTTSYLETHCEFLSNPNLNKWRNLTAVCSYHRSCKIVVQSLYQKRRWQRWNCVKSPKVISFCPNRTFYAKIANISNNLNDPNDSNIPVIREIYAIIRNLYLQMIEKFSIFAVANTKN